jgi:hypothetical protein
MSGINLKVFLLEDDVKGLEELVQIMNEKSPKDRDWTVEGVAYIAILNGVREMKKRYVREE